MLDELNRLNPYEYMDFELDKYRKYLVRKFEKYRIAIRKGVKISFCDELYEALRKKSDKLILRVARRQYKVCGGKKDPKKLFDEDWLFDFLLEYDNITGYVYSNEWSRKKARTYEESVAAYEAKKSPKKQLKRAMTLLNQQITQKAIEACDVGMTEAYKEKGSRKIIWHTQEDEKVCEICYPRNNKTYDISKIPEKHYNCRCWWEPYEN